MEIGQDLVNSSKKHQSRRTVKDKFPHLQGDRSSKCDDLKVKNLVNPPYCDLKGGLTLDVHFKNSLQQKLSRGEQGQGLTEKVAKDDELVKYMSNLPGYLQGVDKGENFQEKALNVGVLDWGRLEKWKHKQRLLPAKITQNASFSSSSTCTNRTMPSLSRVVPGEDCGSQSKLHAACSSLRHSRKDRSKCAKSPLDGQKHMTWASKSLDRHHLDERFQKDKRKVLDKEMISKVRPLSSSWEDSKALHIPEQRVKDLEPDIVKGDGEFCPNSEASSTTSIYHKVSSRLNAKISARRGETKKILKQIEDADVSLSNEYCSSQRRNIVLLFPRKSHQSLFSKLTECPESGTVSAGKLTDRTENLKEESKDGVLHGCSPKKVHCAEVDPEVSSRPLPSRVKSNNKVNSMPHSPNTLKNELSSNASCKFLESNDMPGMLPGETPMEKYRSNLQSTNSHLNKDKPESELRLNTRPVNSRSVENFKTLDQETAELTAKRCRNQSPTRRFSFSLHRLSRSFSFKEGSAVPQLSSTYATVKSGPVTSGAPAYLDSSNEDKGKGHRRTSPLRRLLDPLLKSKGSKSSDPPQPTESVQPLKRNLDSDFKPVHTSGSLRKGKDGEPMIQAVLQLTIKNGVPFYKFVVDNEHSILAATLKTSNLPDKDNSGYNYMFYSLNEIKKKSGSWISQGSKCKSSGFVSNLIGQMKFSSYSASNLAGQDTSTLYMMKEFVLLGVEVEQADKELPKLKLNGELAAVVFKISGEMSGRDGYQSEKDIDYLTNSCTERRLEDKCHCNLRGSGTSNETTVILPGGIHSLPLNGEPSPLITRWRFGGTCDCGGWDVGCTLRVLSNEKKRHKIQGKSKASSLSECFELFDQGAAQRDRPIFSLRQLEKGLCSVKFNSSVSSLQAFFICVAILSGQNQTSLSEVSNGTEAKVFQEPSLGGNEKMEAAFVIPAQGTTKYIPTPPHSPVGRV